MRAIPEWLNGAVKIAAATSFTIYIYYKAAGAIISIGWWYAASAAAVLLLRWCGGGIASVQRELIGVYDDWTAAIRFLRLSHIMSWRDVYINGMTTVGYLPKYAGYGPFIWAFYDMRFYKPAEGAWMVVKYLQRNGSMKASEVGLMIFLVLGFFVITHEAHTIAHRFFAHRCFRTSRAFTFVLACFATLGMPPVWWASIHRRHHRHSDEAEDPHSPLQKGFVYAYFGWLFDRDNFKTRLGYVRDWVNPYPELLLVDLFQGQLCYLIMQVPFYFLWPFVSWWFGVKVPRYMVVNPCCIGNIWGVHMGMMFNAFSHGEVFDDVKWFWPARRPERTASNEDQGSDAPGTKDVSALLAAPADEHTNSLISTIKSRTFISKDMPLISFVSGGEGYHARHHAYPRLAQNSPYWYEDWVFWLIWVFEKCGLVWEVQRPAEDQ